MFKKRSLLGANSKVITILLTAMCFTSCSQNAINHQSPTTLKQAFEGKFLIGATMNSKMVANESLNTTQIVKQHFYIKILGLYFLL